ncbi:AAA family ATPase [Candidatus Sumerlaeota bacterium]
MIIGVTGFFAAGKDSCAAYLEQQGFGHLSLSDIIRQELEQRGEEINIANLTRTGNELRRQFGFDVLAQRALRRMTTDQDYVVTSIRHPDEVRALRGAERPFTMLFVDAPQRLRFERSQQRRRAGDETTLEAFAAAEQAQLDSADPATQQLRACRQLADQVLDNDTGLAELHDKIDRALKQLGLETQ